MEHYFSSQPETAHRPRLLTARFHGVNFEFLTDSSVFSRKQIDFGTQLLLNTLLSQGKPPAGRWLDLGCGYGVVGLVLKRCWPHLDIWLSDVNQRAVEISIRNAEHNRVGKVQVVVSDGFENLAGTFDHIVQNPPVRAGKRLVYRLFAESFAALNPGGQLTLVLRKQQGAASAVTQLGTYFASVEILAKKSGYWIISCQKAGAEVDA